KTLLARYRCPYAPKQGHLREVSAPTLYATAFRSPQLELIELDDEQWRKCQRRPLSTYTRHRAM
ncbi:MAG TPA: hypothetical protein VLK82_23030, partial [Candidatus Tectomicrobia bacterium]|nr:hypothetical protein [Candidatus Tectomicrobia bacterium]